MMGLGVEGLLASGRAHIVDVRARVRTVVDLLGSRVVRPASIGLAAVALEPRLLAWVEERLVLASLARLSALLRLTGGPFRAGRTSPISGNDRHSH
jgi:hypothetical protein